jgi:flavin reductase (DIM6/NTAB) family NADH-FMN oxidoreductase RutF
MSLAFVEYRPSELATKEPYYLLTSLVVPRPIAWVSTISAEGVLNLAPHSYFNVISSDPPIVHFTSTGVKDTLTNCRATGEFVVNFVARDLVEEMNVTAADFPSTESEWEWAGLESEASVEVKPPRVARAKAAFECRVADIVSKGNGNMVFGDVLVMHVDDSVLRDGRVDPELLQPVGRMGGATYTAAASDLFDLKRPTYQQIVDSKD